MKIAVAVELINTDSFVLSIQVLRGNKKIAQKFLSQHVKAMTSLVKGFILVAAIN